MNSINKRLIVFAALSILYSCNKNKLNVPALGQLDQSALANKKGVEGLLIGAYSMLDGESGGNINEGSAASNWIYGSVCGSEAYKGGPRADDLGDVTLLETFAVTAFNGMLAQKWAAVYDGIARANDALRVMRKATDMSQDDTIQVRAEALFLRAFYHFEAKKMWNRIPFVDENITVDAGNYHVANDTSWSPIENDLKYAIAHLPSIQSAPGRANQYAAKAFLAKAYMFQHKYSEAQPILIDLIANGQTSLGEKYSLAKNYHDNFDPDKKNGPESVFAAQMSVNDGASPDGQNGNLGDFPNYPTTIGYGFFQPSQYLVNHFKTNSITGLPDLTHFNEVDVTNDEGFASSDSSFVPYQGWLDPRLDWTVGRRGIPYLDWGIHPGADWIRFQSFGGPYSPIKNVIGQSENGKYADNAWGTSTINANNVNLLRFADILLWAAEVEIEIGSLPKATEYVNMIRKRMEDSSGWVHTYIDPNNPQGGFTNTSAAHYRILEYPTFSTQEYGRQAVRYERMLELGMEGHRFFDLVRWQIASTEINAYIGKEQTLRDYFIRTSFTPGKNEYFPIPYNQIVLSEGQNGLPLMIQNPNY